MDFAMGFESLLETFQDGRCLVVISCLSVTSSMFPYLLTAKHPLQCSDEPSITLWAVQSIWLKLCHSLRCLKSLKPRGIDLTKVPIPSELASLVLNTIYIKCKHPSRNTSLTALTQTGILALLFWCEVTAHRRDLLSNVKNTQHGAWDLPKSV